MIRKLHALILCCSACTGQSAVAPWESGDNFAGDGAAGSGGPTLPPTGRPPGTTGTDTPGSPSEGGEGMTPAHGGTMNDQSRQAENWSAAESRLDHPTGDRVRFIAVGDTGTGDDNQLAVAQVMADTCAREGCDFVILLGDNIYDQGPVSVDDPQWQLKFEQPYAALDVPFYVVLGNHDVADNGLLGTGYTADKSAVEVRYSQQSSKWMMPAPHYALSAGPVGFLMLDTTALYNHVVSPQGDQHQWVGPARDELSDAHAWILSAGHHPYVSNGDHGNAGAYAHFDFDPGTEIKSFFEANLCGQVDIVLAGHDHNRQWLDPSLCAGTDAIVSGAGAKVRGLPGHNPSSWQSEELGFLYVVADDHTLTGQFIGVDGVVDYEQTLAK